MSTKMFPMSVIHFDVPVLVIPLNNHAIVVFPTAPKASAACNWGLWRSAVNIGKPFEGFWRDDVRDDNAHYCNREMVNKMLLVSLPIPT